MDCVSLERAGVPWWIWVIVLMAIVVRLAFSATRSINQSALAALPDQLEYVGIAESVQMGEGLRFYDRTFNDYLSAYRMPGYPALILIFNDNLRIVQAVQATLDGSAVLAVFLIGRSCGRYGVGALAAVAVAFNPFLIYFSSLFLSETLFTAMLIWGVWRLLSDRPIGRAIGILLLSAAVYVRPSAVGLGVVAAGCAFAVGPTFAVRLRRGVLAAALAAVALVALLTPWALRNRAVTGSYVWMTTNDGFTAFDAFNPQADGSSNQGQFRASLADQERAEGERSLFAMSEGDTPRPPIPVHDEVTRSKLLSALAWDYARGHPGRVVTLAFAKLGRFWSPVPLSADFGGKWLYVVVGGLYCVPLFVFAALGVVRGGLGKRMTLTLLLPALYFTAVHSLAVGSLRYRVPCDVPLAVLAAAGAVSLVRPKAVA